MHRVLCHNNDNNIYRNIACMPSVAHYIILSACRPLPITRPFKNKRARKTVSTVIALPGNVRVHNTTTSTDARS